MSNSVQVNDLVEFKYDGGSKPGSTRFVRVNSCNDDCLSGTDIYGDHDDNFRNFNLLKVRDLKVLHRVSVPQNRVVLESNGVLIERKNGSTLSLVYDNNAFNVSYNNGNTNKNVSFSLPTKNDTFINELVGVLKEFSK